MKDRALVYVDCPFCIDGKQMSGGEEVNCLSCGGVGHLRWGKQYLDDNIISTYQIMEATVASEYNALSDANKDAYRQIVSCGIVDLSEGTAIHTKLWALFDSESTTRAHLVTLLA